MEVREEVVRRLEGKEGWVEVRAHDFLEEQPGKGDVFMLRQILHGWSDIYATKIVRALIIVLKKGVRVVVNDVVLPEPGVVEW